MTEARQSAGGKGTKSQVRLRVMIIDPNPNHRDRLKDLVRDVEFVDSVSDRGTPQGVLDILAQNPVHILMIDREPGVGDVFEVVRQLRAKSAAAKARFILIGEDLDEEVQRKGAEVGIVAYLPRPYDMRAVETALLRSIGGNPAKEAEAEKAREALRDTLDKLRKVAIFKGFSDQELVRLLKICRTRQFGAGNHVFRQGEPGHTLYVIVAGTLEIRSRTQSAEHVLVEMGPGDCFGEIAIIDAEPRSADAVAATDCTVIEVNESVVNNNDDILSLKLVRQIAILLAKKLREQSDARMR